MTQEMTSHSITATTSALAQVAKVLQKESSNTFLRISVLGGGCSGFQYKFETDTTPLANDFVINQNNAIIHIDETSIPFLEGSVIDYTNELIGASFKIQNPNATASCGCGTSFTI